MLRLLFDRKTVACRIELGDPIAFRVVHPVAEHRGVAILLGRADRLPKHAREARAVEDVVAQDEAHRVFADEFLADQKCLGQAVRGRLFRVLQADSIIRAVAKQATEARKVLRCRDQKNIPNPRQHQNRQRIIDHRLVVNGQKLFAYSLRDRVQTRARSSGQYDTFHDRVLLFESFIFPVF